MKRLKIKEKEAGGGQLKKFVAIEKFKFVHE